MALKLGVRAPLFRARTHGKANFAFGSLGGLYVLLVFMPEDEAASAELTRRLTETPGLFDDVDRVAFGVFHDPARFEAARARRTGIRHFLDDDRAVADVFRLTEAERHEGRLVLLDPTLRVLANGPPAGFDDLIRILGELGPAEDHAKTPVHAPVLVVPRIFEPAFCRRLISYYEEQGGGDSGVMREIDGRTVGVLDDFKKRKDATVEDDDLRREISGRIFSRLLPEIEKVFMFKATRMERYLVARYDAEEGGYFRAHRDNNTKGTAHRQFACSINLNAEAFEGGDLRFPEFGKRTYRPPTGGAVIFSCALLHEATPVTRGTRFAFLPFFYDEAHAKIRQENLGFIETGTHPDAASAA